MSLAVGGVKEMGNRNSGVEGPMTLWYVGFPFSGRIYWEEKAMQRTYLGILICAVAVVLALSVACGGGGAAKEDQAKAEEWAWLTETQQTLISKRTELVDLVGQLEAAAAAEVAEGEAEAEVAEGGAEAEGAASEAELVATTEDLAAQIEQLGGETEALTEEFGNRLVAFINADPMIEGEVPTEQQVQALRMKSGEDIILAQEWIERGGDYKRAIEIISTALIYDPDNADLQAALAKAEADRYMVEERWAAAEKGMTEDDVRKVLGQVNLHNIREYPDKDVVAWFYPVAEDGSAAAVWFQPNKKSGVMEVYQIKFDAIRPDQPEEPE
jgi:hypothetical protein